jgi:NitT/TauT family transport system permease protein
MDRVIKIALTFSAFLLIWYLVVTLFKTPTYILPDPVKVFESFVLNRFTIFTNAFITIKEAFFGFLIANVISILIALGIAFNKNIENTIMPFAITLKTIPIIAVTPLLVVWFGPGEYSKIATAALICFFPSLVNVLRGVKSLDRDLVEFFKAYSANKEQLTKILIIPSSLPYLFAALKVSSSLAVVGALVGEFIGANKGLGFLIISNYYTLNTPLVFASIMVSSLIGIVFYYTIYLFEKRMITWTATID